MEPSNSVTRRVAAMLVTAREAAQNAYAPYSGFRVGAALRLTNGEIVTGSQRGERQLRADHLRGAFRAGERRFPIRAGDSH